MCACGAVAAAAADVLRDALSRRARAPPRALLRRNSNKCIPVTFARTSFCDPRKLGFSLRLLSTALLAQLAERTPLKKTRRSREFILSPSYRKTIACGHGFEPHGGYEYFTFLRLSFLFLICRHKKVYLLGTGDAGCTPCSIRHVCISRPRTRAACNNMVVASSGVPRLTNHPHFRPRARARHGTKALRRSIEHKTTIVFARARILVAVVRARVHVPSQSLGWACVHRHGAHEVVAQGAHRDAAQRRSRGERRV